MLPWPFDALFPSWSEGFGASDGEAVGLLVSRPWRIAKPALVSELLDEVKVSLTRSSRRRRLVSFGMVGTFLFCSNRFMVSV